LELTDHDLIKICLSGQQDAFGDILTRYKKLIYNVIYNFTGSHPDTNDLFQEAFLRMYRSLRSYNPEYQFATWAVKITSNVCLDWLKKKKHETVSVDDIPELGDKRANPEEQYMTEERLKIVRDAIQKLPYKYRMPVVLFHQQGLSYKEMEDILNEPETIIKNRLYRARLMLKESLNPVKEDF
jgi:RNA polymerase sigma-70 factor (ECF subfamily)